MQAADDGANRRSECGRTNMALLHSIRSSMPANTREQNASTFIRVYGFCSTHTDRPESPSRAITGRENVSAWHWVAMRGGVRTDSTGAVAAAAAGKYVNM